MAYSKLHSSIVNSSLWVERDSTRILFVTLLAMCDIDGVVYGSRGGLSRLANIDPEDIDEAWECLLSADPDSSDKMRAPEHGGRRIEEVSGGFRLLNFAYYRGLRNDDERREQNRAAQARFRDKNQPPKAGVSQAKPPKAHTETDTEAEAEAENTTPPTSELVEPRQSAAPPTATPAFDGTNFDAINGKAVVHLAQGFTLPGPWGIDAEALGFKPAEVMREGEKFRQYWVEGKGKGTRRSIKGWRQTWSNWLEKTAKDHR